MAKVHFLILFMLMFVASWSQEYVPGQSYFSDDNFVEYIAGNLPIVISVPHGGELLPASIPDRNCSGCTTVKDSYTQELCRELADEIFNQSGCHPHVIINLLHRKKLDANREIVEAANGNADAEQSWYAYHRFINLAKDNIELHWGKGLFIDLHGHGHTKQRLELGYLLTTSQLSMSDALLDSKALIDKSSIKHLVASNKSQISHAQLIRGALSFGAFTDNVGYPAVPSPSDVAPLVNDDYFNGGYNVLRHGSRDTGKIDGIQIECNSSVRFDSAIRKKFAKDLSEVIATYLKSHYFDQLDCGLVLTKEPPLDYQVYPNPASQELVLNMAKPIGKVSIFNAYGQKVTDLTMKRNVETIDVSEWPCGIYFIIHGGIATTHRSFAVSR